jgi:hypothetical protein
MMKNPLMPIFNFNSFNGAESMVQITLVTILTNFVMSNSRKPKRIEMYKGKPKRIEMYKESVTKIIPSSTKECEQVIHEAQMECSKEQEAPSPTSTKKSTEANQSF